ncbi:hypothetical protein N752_12950 [Desulforamulus aquiferis]|nr:hypothetical protein N752_12950 [Desulforamulus aquiferis]
MFHLLEYIRNFYRKGLRPKIIAIIRASKIASGKVFIIVYPSQS